MGQPSRDVIMSINLHHSDLQVLNDLYIQHHIKPLAHNLLAASSTSKRLRIDFAREREKNIQIEGSDLFMCNNIIFRCLPGQ